LIGLESVEIVVLAFILVFAGNRKADCGELPQILLGA
jgi:hypothetical protein